MFHHERDKEKEREKEGEKNLRKDKSNEEKSVKMLPYTYREYVSDLNEIKPHLSGEVLKSHKKLKKFFSQNPPPDSNEIVPFIQEIKQEVDKITPQKFLSFTIKDNGKAQFLSLLNAFENKANKNNASLASRKASSDNNDALGMLDDYCWVEIFSHLTLSQQAQAGLSCKFFNDRYHSASFPAQESMASNQPAVQKQSDLIYIPRIKSVEKKLKKNPQCLDYLEEAYLIYRERRQEGDREKSFSYVHCILDLLTKKKPIEIFIDYPQHSYEETGRDYFVKEYIFEAFFSKRNYKIVIDCCNFLIEQNSQCHTFYNHVNNQASIVNLKGMAYFMLGNYTEAKACFVEAYKNNFFPARENLELTMQVLGESTSNLPWLKKDKGRIGVPLYGSRDHSPSLYRLVDVSKLLQQTNGSAPSVNAPARKS